jgi:hypothetical protein
VVVLVPRTLTVDHLALTVPRTLHPEERNTVTVEDGHKYVMLLVYVPTTTWVALTMNVQWKYLAMDMKVPPVELDLYVTCGLVLMKLMVVLMIVTAEPTVTKLPVNMLVPTEKISVSKTQHAQMDYKMEVRLVLTVVVAVRTPMCV